MKRPNAILFVKSVQNKQYTFVYVRDGNSYLGPYEKEYVKTTDPLNLDPFENWLDYIPDKEWVYPVVAIKDDTGWLFRPYDTYNEVRWEDKPTTLNALHDSQNLFKFFDFVLDTYKNMTDEELEKELSIGRLDTLQPTDILII